MSPALKAPRTPLACAICEHGDTYLRDAPANTAGRVLGTAGAGWPGPRDKNRGAMARRSKTTNAEALIDLVALLPWWAGVALAFLSYVILHSIASQPVATTVVPGQVGAMVSQTLFRSLAAFGQVVAPIVCLAGAGVSAWRRRERQRLVVDVAQSKA